MSTLVSPQRGLDQVDQPGLPLRGAIIRSGEAWLSLGPAAPPCAGRLTLTRVGLVFESSSSEGNCASKQWLLGEITQIQAVNVRTSVPAEPQRDFLDSGGVAGPVYSGTARGLGGVETVAGRLFLLFTWP